MNEFLGLLEDFRRNDKTFVVSINCKKTRVKVVDTVGDMVTLTDLDSSDRFDLHYTGVIICSQREG